MALHMKKGLAKPLVIFLAAVGLGMFVLGLTLTIIGTLPGYSPYGGNPLKIVGPILLVLGVLIIAGVIVEWCVRSQRDRNDKEKGFPPLEDYSQPKATFHSSSLPKKKKDTYEPPLQTSTPGNVTLTNPSPAFSPHDALPQNQAKLARTDSREGVPLPNPPPGQQQQQQQQRQQNGYNAPHPQQQQQRVQKNAHFEPIHQAPTTHAVQYAQVVHPQRQQSSSSGNYFYPSVTNGYQYQQGQQQQNPAHNIPPHSGYVNPNPNPNGTVTSGSNVNSGNKMRWGSSKESLDDHLEADSKNELPVLDIANAGRDGTTRRSKGKGDKSSRSGPGDKYGRSGSYRAAHTEKESSKPTKSPRAQRRSNESERRSNESERYAVENHGYVRERAIDVEPNQSTPRDRDGYNNSHNTSREGAGGNNSNFSRRNSSRTRRGSKRRQRSDRGSDQHGRERSRDREHDTRSRDRSRERPRERSSSRGRLGLDDSTTLDYVRGVPIDKESRRKSGSDDRRHHHQHRDREGDARRNYYDSDDSHIIKSHSTSPSDMSHPSDQRTRHKQTYHNEAFMDDSRALTPRTMTAEDVLKSKMKDSKNMNFTININAQPGAAVQIALGNKDLPTPKPMITATPGKAEIRTTLDGMDNV